MNSISSNSEQGVNKELGRLEDYLSVKFSQADKVNMVCLISVKSFSVKMTDCDAAEVTERMIQQECSPGNDNMSNLITWCLW